MTTRPTARGPRAGALAGVALGLVFALPHAGSAQQAPGAAHTPPDDTPAINVGVTVFADYTSTRAPRVEDADGNRVSPGAFNIGRSYINVTGRLSHLVAFRVTPDVARQGGSGGSLDGSLVFRIKYAFAQVNLDDWLPKGTWLRFGIQQTPFVDDEEAIYRYRFQGTVFAEREGYLASSDAGVSFHAAFPGERGDVHVGVYNGEGYAKAETNNQKALQARASVRPAPGERYLRGFRVTGFYDADHYVARAERRRAVLSLTYEHPAAHVGFDLLDTRDRASAADPSVHGRGWSVWGTPRLGRGIEALLRYDRMRRDLVQDGRTRRAIAGVSYWFPAQGSRAAAVLLDYEQVSFSAAAPPQPTQKRVAVHAVVSF